MKKILFASTALVATAGVAAAEITIGGSARFGLAYNEAETNETRIEQRMRVNITGIAETDAGVKLEARFRLEANEDDHENSISGRGPGAAGFAVSYGGLRVDVGNVSNVLDSGDQVDYFGYGIGFTSFLEANSNFNGPATGFGAGSAPATTIKVRYTVGDFSASLSYKETREQDLGLIEDGENIVGVSLPVAADEEWQLGLGYTLANGMAIGAVYSDTDSAGDYWVLGLNGTAGAVGYTVMVGDGDNQDDVSVSASINYEVSSATSIRALVADGGVTGADTAYGLGFRHGLGGGVTLAGGVGSDSSGNTLADLGVSFSF
ncbi:porin [Tritonibacter mobilis]|uniref:porin n=1 Tax=Tritonibacter mobilis TaxID=379347 RepID=UPI001403AF39|nr:porin [Tritonibacter mobilis]NHM18760.1 porin [Tritonibacter mobilis]NHM22856.1 porin [Tritonibacter mobilis]